jgi:RNA polymerase sigma factor (sigma-70 family)
MIYRKIRQAVIRGGCARVSLTMFNLVDPSEPNVASSPPALRVRTGLKTELSAKAQPLAMKTKYDPTDWITHMTRIRDTQDHAAFAELFQYFAPRVKAFLMRSGADATLAEECTQEVMATLWQKAHLFDASRASVATWVFTIARNRKIDALRKQRRPEPEDLVWGPEEEPDQADVLSLQQESEQLGRAIAALPEKQRELIEKAYFGDLSHSEIAEQTGLPLGTIKSRIRLALDRLRHAMK